MILNLEQMMYARFSTKISRGKKHDCHGNFFGSEWQKNHLWSCFCWVNIKWAIIVDFSNIICTSTFRGEDFYRFRRSEIRIAHANHFLPDQGKMLEST
jgi:hypothetical protein